jgi:hypothetical protein
LENRASGSIMTATAITSLGEDTEVPVKAKRRSFTVE